MMHVNLLLDLDGVVWIRDTPIEGSGDAVQKLLDHGFTITFVTNNSTLTADGYAQKLARMGVVASPSQIVHSGHAVGRLVEPAETVLLCAGEGVAEGIKDANGICIDPINYSGKLTVDAVVVGLHPDFSHDELNCAIRAVLSGARLLAPSSDKLYPTETGFVIDGGALAHAVSYATGAEPIFAGKPRQPMIDAVNERINQAKVDFVIGDSLASDARFAAAMGIPFAFVRSTAEPPAPNPAGAPCRQCGRRSRIRYHERQSECGCRVFRRRQSRTHLAGHVF